MRYRPIIYVAGLLLWLAVGSSQAFADTYTVSDSPAITDHGDPIRPGSLQWTLNRAGSAPATVVLPADANYNIGTPATRREVVIRTNINLVFRPGAVITFGSSGSTLKVFGSVDAGLLKLFSAAPGQVRFQGYDPEAGSSSPLKYRRAVIKEVYPQWWGAINHADYDPAKNLRAFRAAFLAFPTRVSIPSGIYTLSDEWRLDFREIPEVPNASEFETSFEVAGAGHDSAVLIQAANSQSPQFVGIYGDYPSGRFWASGKFYGLKLLNPKGTGLKVQNPRIHVSDLHVGVVPAGGAGIELMANSIGCLFEHILLSGPATFLGPFPPNPAFDPEASTLASGFKCGGGNVQDTVISRLVASTFDIGINLFGRGGGIVGWKILNCDLGGNQIGINFRGSNTVNSVDIIGTYMEMWPADGAYGIRLDPVAPPFFVRIEGGRIDPKGPNARPIEIHGIYHIIDVQYAADIYGTLGTGTQIRMGVYRGP